MKFYLKKDRNPELILKANNTDIDLRDRWVLRNAGYFMKNEVGNSIEVFIKVRSRERSGDKKLQKTSLALCEDTFLERTVLAKTVCYEEGDLDNVNAINIRRKMLETQVDILNNVCSNMLPEPLDFFLVTNNYDQFNGQDTEKFKETEPVLILDYIPGEILSYKLQNEKDKMFYRAEEGKPFKKNPEIINVGMIMRLIGDIVVFESELYDKGYAYTSLSPDHIILLGDNKPRFVGIGRICPINADRYDYNHVNFGRQLKGYSAPEFNQKETNFGMHASVKAAIAYNLGVLIACIILGKTEFDEDFLDNGAYDYRNAVSDRNAIRSAKHGEWIDDLVCNLTNMNPAKRMTDFEQIMQELVVISGDAKSEKKGDAILYGTIKFLAKDKGYGYVTTGEEDFRVDLKRIDNLPAEDGDQVGQPVTFIAGRNLQGQGYVRAFVIPPKTEVRYPRFVKKPAPIIHATGSKPEP